MLKGKAGKAYSALLIRSSVVPAKAIKAIKNKNTKA